MYVFVPIFRGKLLPFSSCPLDVPTDMLQNNMLATCLEFEMQCLPLRGGGRGGEIVQTPPGLSKLKLKLKLKLKKKR